MYLTGLTLKNWMPYRGTNSLQLGPKAYAITARKSNDADRSNWLGKSAILEAIYFALTGMLNPDRHLPADGWVSDGTKEGSVLLPLSDGTVVERGRKGKSPFFEVHGAHGTAKGDEAQTILDGLIGLTANDMLATIYFQQRKMARLVLEKNAERMEYISSWLQLAPLEKGEELLRSKIATLAAEAQSLADAHKRAVDAEIAFKTELQPYDTCDTERDLKAAIAKHERMQALLERNASLERAPRVRSEWESASQQVTALECEIAKFDPNLDRLLHHAEENAKACTMKLGATRRDHDAKKRLATIGFDGVCPVISFKCPAQTEIEKRRTHFSDAFEKLTKELDEVDVRHDAALKVVDGYRGQIARKQRLESDLEHAKRTRAQLALEVEKSANLPPAADPDDLRRRVQMALDEVTKLTAVHTRVAEMVKQLRAAREAKLAAHEALLKVTARLAAYREALVIFGKQGAQRRVAESALAVIQEGANEMLRESGIDLDVEVSWSREGGGPAKACDSCGNPFPASRAVKTCIRCNAERGPHLVNRLDIILSEQSGAAEDLVGAALQLSASAWLRSSRGSRWSSAFIDEPFGSCDRAQRRALTRAFTTMLSSRYGFEQAFIVSHTADIDAFPGRIEIVNDGSKSVVRVAA